MEWKERFYRGGAWQQVIFIFLNAQTRQALHFHSVDIFLLEDWIEFNTHLFLEVLFSGLPIIFRIKLLYIHVFFFFFFFFFFFVKFYK